MHFVCQSSTMKILTVQQIFNFFLVPGNDLISPVSILSYMYCIVAYFVFRIRLVDIFFDEIPWRLRPATASRSLRLPHVSFLLCDWLDGYVSFKLNQYCACAVGELPWVLFYFICAQPQRRGLSAFPMVLF
jgi:hypothetical protein